MAPKILITGGAGLLGTSLHDFYKKKYDLILGLNKTDVKLSNVKKIFLNYQNSKNLENQIKNLKPEIVINCIGLSNVEICEKNKKKAIESNIKIPLSISNICNKLNIKFYHISTDHLYDGKKFLYKETDKKKPLNFYAKTKLLGDNKILLSNKKACIIRTNFFSNGGKKNVSFSDKIIKNLKENKKIYLFYDVFFSPIFVPTFAKILENTFDKNFFGIFNLGSPTPISKYEFGILIAKIFNFNKDLIKPISITSKKLVNRPTNMSLDSSKILKKINFKVPTISRMILKLKEDYQNKNFKKLPYGMHSINDNDIHSVVKTLRSGHLTQGPQVFELEKKIAKYVKCKYAVAVSSCTAGMHIALKSLQIKKNSKVLLPPITFVSTANVVIMNDLKPQFVDISPDSANMDMLKAIKALDGNKNIKAVMPVHFAGYPCDLRPLQSFRKKIKIVEDAAHAMGSKYLCGSMVGSCKYSDLCVFSLHPVKTIAAGEGGVITTNSYEIYKRLLRLRSHGINKADDKFLNKKNSQTKNKINQWYYEMRDMGYHYRLTDIQCSLAISQLKRINVFLKKRQKIVNYYNKKFIGFDNMKILDPKPGSLSSNHIYILQLDFKKLKISRQEFIDKLKRKKVLTQVHYIPVTMHPYYQKLGYSIKSTPEAMKYYEQALSIPIYYGLTEYQQNHVISSIKKILNNVINK
jgi:perosamine synthetase